MKISLIRRERLCVCVCSLRSVAVAFPTHCSTNIQRESGWDCSKRAGVKKMKQFGSVLQHEGVENEIQKEKHSYRNTHGHTHTRAHVRREIQRRIAHKYKRICVLYRIHCMRTPIAFKILQFLCLRKEGERNKTKKWIGREAESHFALRWLCVCVC